MITSTLRIVFNEPTREEALRVLRGLVGPVRSHPGCLATRLMQDVDDERVLTWADQWRRREDHERHVRSDAFRRLLAVMDLAAEPPTFEVDEVERRHGYELVEKLLGRPGEEPGCGFGPRKVMIPNSHQDLGTKE